MFGAGLKLMQKPLEGLVLIALGFATVAGLGVWASWWTLDDAMAFVTPIFGNVAIAAVKVLGPVSDLALVVGLAYGIHSIKKGAEIAVAAGIVALISWRFGGQDWMSQLPALLRHTGH
jgi:hypothetical protein